MFFAKIETDSGEVLRLARPDGRASGKPLVSLLTPFSVYCLLGEKHPEVDHWMAALAVELQDRVCDSVATLERGTCSKERDFGPDDFDFYQAKFSQLGLTRDHFDALIRKADLARTPILISLPRGHTNCPGPISSCGVLVV